MSDLMQAMADAGAPFEAILIAVRALEAKDAEISERDAIAAERKAKDAARSNARRAMLPVDWLDLRSIVFERDHWTCQYCGTVEADQWHCDHVYPLSRGGTNDIENLVTACRSCNSSKGAKTPEEWAA